MLFTRVLSLLSLLCLLSLSSLTFGKDRQTPAVPWTFCTVTKPADHLFVPPITF